LLLAALADLAKIYPEYTGQGYKIAGFVWWQGHKDQNAVHAARYEQNLKRLISSLRKDYNAPNAKFVLATGCGNPGRENLGLQIAEAQLAIADPERYPEFTGNVKAVDVRDLWREADVSPKNQGYHDNRNAETYLEVGTVVVYTSDNGYYLGEHCSGDKRSLYEESIRIPMLVRYPRLFAKGRVIDEMVVNIDLAPTFLDVAGIPVPKEMQGASWKELAAGRKPANWRTAFFAQYYKELGNVPTCYAVRTATHKLVKYPNRPEWTEVFDLTEDPYEIRNLATDAALRTKLEAELDSLIKAVDYTVPADANKSSQP
jgi:hypothetical protein